MPHHPSKYWKIIKGKFCLYMNFASSFLVKLGFVTVPSTVKILKIGTPEIITIIALQLEQLNLKCSFVFKRCRQNNKQRRP